MATRPLSLRYDEELLDRLTERARRTKPHMSRTWLMNNLLWQGVDPRLDWNEAIREVANGSMTPLQVLIRAAEALSEIDGGIMNLTDRLVALKHMGSGGGEH